MEKYSHFKSTATVNHLKYFINLADDKVGQFYSEPASLDTTPKSTKSAKLEPLDPSLLGKKLAESTTSTSRTPEKKKTAETSSSKSFRPQQKTWLSALEGENTPKDDKQTTRKSKFANAIIESVDQGKQFKDSFSDHLATLTPATTKATSSREKRLSVEIAPQAQSEDEKGKLTPRTETKVQLGRNVSMPSSYKPLHRQVVEKGFAKSNVRPEETLSDNEFNNKTQNIKNDVCATLPYRYLIFGPNIELEVFKKYLVMLHKGLVYATKNLKSPSEKFIMSKQICLPETVIRKTKTLFLDMDETLIHSCMLRENPDIILNCQGSAGESIKQLPIKIRPYLKEFFARVSPIYDIVIFTAATSGYAKTIVNHIDKDKKYISAILSREHCLETKNGFYIKDLRIVKNRELKDMIIVDNLAHSFGFQVDNGIPILEFFDDKKDKELKHLADYLMEAANYDDLRKFNQERLKLRELADKRFEDLFNKYGGLNL